MAVRNLSTQKVTTDTETSSSYGFTDFLSNVGSGILKIVTFPFTFVGNAIYKAGDYIFGLSDSAAKTATTAVDTSTSILSAVGSVADDIAEHPEKFPVLLDKIGTNAMRLGQAWTMFNAPPGSGYIIDKTGKIIRKTIGGVVSSTLKGDTNKSTTSVNANATRDAKIRKIMEMHNMKYVPLTTPNK